MTNVTSLPDPREFPEIMNGLPEERKQKTLRYKQLNDRKQSLGAGLLLEKVLRIRGKSMETIRYGEHGKPEIDGIYFNLSHSHDIAVCAVSDKPVGCDVEKIEEVTKRIAERFFTENEIAYLERFEEEEKLNEFFRIWTMKESYMKMTGEGMSLGLKNFEFIFRDKVEVYRENNLCSCTIKEYEIPGYKLTVCAEETEFAELKHL